DEGAHGQSAVDLLDAVEARDAVDVHEHGWLRESEVEQRGEALPPREHLRIVTVARQELHGFLDAGRLPILERRNHLTLLGRSLRLAVTQRREPRRYHRGRFGTIRRARVAVNAAC